MRPSAPDRGKHCLSFRNFGKAAQRREAAVGSGIIALPFGKPFGADGLENSCGY
jgi:hypothetical protein